MRILIDGTTLCDRTGGAGAGIEHYSFDLTSAMIRCAPEHMFFVYVPKQFPEHRWQALVGNAKNVRMIRSFGTHVPFFSRHIGVPLRFALARPDVLFSPFGQTPLGWRGRSVLTIHDCLVYEHPEWFTHIGQQDISQQVIVPYSIKHAQHIIAVSAFTQQSLERLFPAAIGKTHVVYEGVAIPSVAVVQDEIRFPFDRDYVLALGTIEPRKNLVAAIEAFHLFLEQHPELVRSVRFVIAGKFGWGYEETRLAAERVNHAWSTYEPDGVIRFLGVISEEEKWHILRRASTLFFPSLCEGFGLPVLEAMCVGTPVISTGAGAIDEVGGDAIIRIHPHDRAAMALAIAQCVLLPDAMNTLREEGFRRAAWFTWERAAEETLRVIERVKK